MDLHKRFEEAIRYYWAVRDTQSRKQKAGTDTGMRSAATGGAQMDGMEGLVKDSLLEAGVPEDCIFRKQSVELPGYYRPEKRWDLLVVADDKLVAALEFKSQVGPSFGNNFNNRTEEAIGSAQDIWTAFREGRFSRDFRPWLGYLFLLEDCERSSRPVRNRETHFPVDKVFNGKEGVSYKKQYEILCERLVLERLYDAACFFTSTNDIKVPQITQPHSGLTFSRFIASLRGHVQAFLESASE